MAMTIEEFKALLEKCNVRYFQHPTDPIVLTSFGGMLGVYQITISLQSDGNFLQFRTLNYATCRADNPHLPTVLHHLADFNLRSRWVKWSWNSHDGDISVSGDFWIMDGTVTPAQFDRMIANILGVIDLESERLKTIIETGNDPGEVDPAQLQRQTGGGSPPTSAPTSTPAAAPVTEI